MTPRAVASGHPAVTDAACEVLGRGGNAFDAVVAAGYASAVAEPALTSLGGGGFLLARLRDGHALVFDFFVDTPGRGRPPAAAPPASMPVTVRFPGSAQEFHAGLGSVAVPGALAGYLHVQRRLGRLPLAAVVAPAVRLARAGVRVNAHQGYFLHLLRPIMTSTAAGRALYAPGGRYLREGDVLRNAALADLLAGLPRTGATVLYGGDAAGAIARDMRAAGAALGEEDLRAYGVVERAPLRVAYRGAEILLNPLPARGGALLGLAFHLLAARDVAAMGRGSAGHLRALVAVMREVEDRRADDPGGHAALDAEALATSVARVRVAAGGTTHVSVADGEGNVAGMTTSNGECSGYLAPGTGIMLNNMMGEDDLHPAGFHADPAGQRVASMMCPLIVLAGGRVRLVAGSGGSKRIRTALLQVASAVLDFGASVGDAVEAPRLHWDGAVLQVEPGVAEAALAGLGPEVPRNVWPVRDVYFGGVQAVAPAEGAAAADPRRGGAARVLG